MDKQKLGMRYWLSFIVAGLVGQLAWAVENNFLNLYVFGATGSTKYIPIMTAASAIVATLATILIGVLSDRLGKRKIFISCGYVIWGITIIIFAFIMPNTGNLTLLPIGLPMTGSVLLLSGTLIVIMDCVMSFFGSGANDACFNAYVTEKTNKDIRGKVESVLSILPLVSIIMVVLIGGILVQSSDHHPYWDIFFFILGGITILAGVVCFFLLPNDKILPNKEQSYAENLIHGFKPSVAKKNPILYIALTGFLIFNMAVQVFMPYFMVYVQQTLGIVNEQFTLTLGIVLVTACVLTVILGLFMDKIGKNKIVIPAILVGVVGGVVMFFVKSQVGAIIGGITLISGYLFGTAVLGAKVRDYTPENEAGLLQGVRMVFAVLVPMVTGPYIGQGVSYINAEFYRNPDYGGEVTLLPNKFIFLFTSIIFLLAIPVMIYMIKQEERQRLLKIIDAKYSRSRK